MSWRVVSVALMFTWVVACGGEDGTDGEDGVSWLTAAVPAATVDCPNGGTTVQVGPDGNRNGTLDPSEVASSSNVCNGADGDPSDLWLVATEEADVASCAWGGTIVHTGKDADASEVLEASEFLASQPICRSPVTLADGSLDFIGLGADSRWSTPDNWLNRIVPLEGQRLVFRADSPRKRLENDFPLLSAFAHLELTAGIELFGKKLVLLDSIIAGSQNANVTRIELPLVVRAVPVIVDVAHTGTGVGGLTITGNIEGEGALRKQGSGALYLTGTNTYLGSTTLTNGLLSLAGGNAIPDTSAVVCTSGELLVTAAETIDSIDGGCTLNLVGPVTVVGNVDMTLTGAMTGPAPFNKRGTGFLALTGNGTTHTGALNIETGTVFLNGSYGATPVTVASGAVLSGNGNPGAITVAAGGRVEPGVPGTGILTASGDITLSAGSTLAVKLNGVVSGTGYDRLAANASIALGGATLTVDVGFTASEGNAFTIVQCTGALTGTFDGIADGAALVIEGQRFVVDYTASSVVLTRDDL